MPVISPFNNLAARAGLAVCAAALATIAQAQTLPTVDIGFITTLSTPAGYIGEDERDGFSLAVKQEGGRLGGIPVRLLIEDDGLKPPTGKQSAEKMLQAGVRLFTGINFSNVLVAVVPAVVKEGGFYVSLNAGPSNFAGRACHPNFFSVAMQSDANGEAPAMVANRMGIQKMVIMAPAYQAGRDALAAFKRFYRGEILAEIQTKLEQSDFSVELARLRALQPEAVYTFLPGGAGINFAKQFANSGLKSSIKIVASQDSMDDRMTAATGDASEGFYLSTQWTVQQDNPANYAFVAAFEKEYGRRPTRYAATSYDTARLLASALKAVDGNVTGRADAFRAALRAARFDSVRGNLRFNTNHYPIQDYFLVRVERNADSGKLDYRLLDTIVENHRDVYAAHCIMAHQATPPPAIAAQTGHDTHSGRDARQGRLHQNAA